MALTLTISISYNLSSRYKYKFRLTYSPTTNTIISFVCFLGISMIDHNGQIFDYLGVESIAKAIICAIFSIELIVFFYHNKFSQLSFLQYEVKDDIHNAIRACLPAILVPFIIIGTYGYLLTDIDILSRTTPFFIGEIDYSIGLSLIQSSGLIIINQVVWFFGIHPSSLIEINPSSIYSPIDGAIYARHFFDTYAHLGGAGSTLGLIICLLCSKNKFHKKIRVYAILPGIFNINICSNLLAILKKIRTQPFCAKR